MGSEWKKTSLGEVAILRNGAGVKQEFFSEHGVPLARVSDFTIDSINISDCKYVDQEHARKWQSHLIAEGDVIVATVGSWPPNWSSVVGKVIRAPSEAVGAIQNQNTCCILPKAECLNNRFLFYRLKMDDFVWYAANGAGGSANQARLPVKKLAGFPFPLPPLPVQIAIAHILGTLDDKIELNRRMNATLEGMAQALFKSWFVDFDPVIDNALVAGNPIPEELAERAEVRRKVLADGTANREAAKQFPAVFQLTEEMGWIPEGWEVKPVAEQVHLTMGQSPSSDYYNKDGHGLPFHQGVTNYGERFPKHKQYSTGGNRYAEEGDILFSVRAPVGRINISDCRIIIGRGLSALRHKKNYQGFLVYFLKHVFQKEDSIGSGTIFNAVNKKEMESIPYLVPTDGLAKAFNNIANSLDEKISRDAEQTQTLTNLRDTLLPKLISGELRIPEAEKLTDEALK